MEKKYFGDRELQEENRNKTMEKEIRKSAENLEIPEELKPENLESLLEEYSGKKKGPRKYISGIGHFAYRYGKVTGFAAACAIIAFVFLYTQHDKRLTMNAAPSGETTQAETADTAGNSSSDGGNMDAAEVSDTSSGQKEAEMEDGAYIASENYEEVYKKIYKEPLEAVQEREQWYSRGDVVFSGDEAKASDSAVTLDMAEEEDAGATDSAAYSETNVRTEGVDEGDLVKTDGDYIYTLSRTGSLHIVSADGENLEVAGEIKLENLTDTIEEMYVDKDVLCVIARGYESGLDDQGDGIYGVMNRDYVTLYTYDISDKSHITLKGTVSQDGYYESSRKVGNYVYLFSRYYADLYDPPKEDQIQFFIPSINGARMEASDILYPAEPQTESSQLVISSVNLENPGETAESKSLISGADMYYVSGENIYICMSDYSGEESRTQIASFSYKDGKLTGKAAGKINGEIHNSFSIDEYNGYLRVAATRYIGGWNGTESNSLYVLDESLRVIGKIEDLAKGETIRSARFMGDIGYFVTYRQTDPLFSVDLKDPENPEILGELKITGFSEYLHFYGENRLLGIGWETDPDTGENEGLKMSMFDISNPRNVKEIDKMVLKDVEYCNAVNAYKGILIDPAENIFGMAMGTYNENYDLYGYYGVFSYDEKEGFQKLMFQSLSKWVGNSENTYEVIDDIRGVYIGNTFYLCQGRGIFAFDRTKGYEMTGKLEWG